MDTNLELRLIEKGLTTKNTPTRVSWPELKMSIPDALCGSDGGKIYLLPGRYNVEIKQAEQTLHSDVLPNPVILADDGAFRVFPLSNLGENMTRRTALHTLSIYDTLVAREMTPATLSVVLTKKTVGIRVDITPEGKPTNAYELQTLSPGTHAKALWQHIVTDMLGGTVTYVKEKAKLRDNERIAFRANIPFKLNTDVYVSHRHDSIDLRIAFGSILSREKAIRDLSEQAPYARIISTSSEPTNRYMDTKAITTFAHIKLKDERPRKALEYLRLLYTL